MSKASDRRIRDWADDIREAFQNIQNDIGALSFDGFAADGKTLRAVATSLSNIGEASNRVLSLSSGLEQSDPDLHAQLRGAYLMRNVLQHGYFTTDARIVWDTVSLFLPRLIERLNADPKFAKQ